ncbi:hypothetical protein ACFQDJ_04170 [Pseudomonas brassicacearum]
MIPLVWGCLLFLALSSRGVLGCLSISEEINFFFVIESLLNEGRIKFIAPGADCYVSPDNEKPKFSVADSAAQWDLEAGQIISYLKGKWPKNVASDNDEDLTFYFYEVPGVIWIDERGGYFSS